jgi:hypothetical protein
VHTRAFRFLELPSGLASAMRWTARRSPVVASRQELGEAAIEPPTAPMAMPNTSPMTPKLMRLLRLKWFVRWTQHFLLGQQPMGSPTRLRQAFP